MANVLRCDNPMCEVELTEKQLGEAGIAENELPAGWVGVDEYVGGDGAAGVEEVELGEFCSRDCAAAFLRLGDPDKAVEDLHGRV